MFFISLDCPGNLPGHVNWDTSRPSFYYVRSQDLRPQDLRNNSKSGSQTLVSGFQSFFRLSVPHVIAYPLAIKSNNFPPSSPLTALRFQSSSTLPPAMMSPFVFPLPTDHILWQYKPKCRYSRLRATRRRVSGFSLCSFLPRISTLCWCTHRKV